MTVMIDAMSAALSKTPGATHWLMTSEMQEQYRCTVMPASLAETRGTQREEAFGLPIYVADTLGAPGWTIGIGEPPDDILERDVRQRLAELDRCYRQAARSLRCELASVSRRNRERHGLRRILKLPQALARRVGRSD